MKKCLSKLSVLFLLVFFMQGNSNAQTEKKVSVPLVPVATPSVAIGTWAELTNLAPQESAGLMLLLTDGRVLCQDEADDDGSGIARGWEILTPSATGSYLNGTWTTTGNNIEGHLFCNSQVLPNGEVMVAGGEYGDGANTGEIYNPVTGTWSSTGALPSSVEANIYDGNSEILYDGTILSGPQADTTDCCSEQCLYYNPSTNDWSIAPKAPEDHDEAQWLKLPDSSILFIGMATKKSCRFRPQTSTWISDANVPVSISDTFGYESGPGVLLPNGQAIFFGGYVYNAIYTPSGGVANGSWVAGPEFPKIGSSYVGITDGPGAMMVNGHVLLSVSPIGTSEADEFKNPAYFMEYDYVTNTLVQVTSTIPGIGSDEISSNTCSNMTFLDLPDGTVLVDESQNNTASLNEQFYIYTPGSAAIPQGKPTINSILPDGCPYYKLTGKLFNGISEGTEYGDDLQQSSNYPLVRLTNSSGDVYYCKTTLWNRIGAVVTDSLEDTTVFETPTGLPAGTYSLVVIANGFASNPTIFTTLQTNIGSQENVLCNGGTGTATASVTGGISPYTYAWTATGGSSVTGTGLSAGTYTVTVKDNNDCSATATVVITQPSKVTATATVSANTSCSASTGAATSSVSGGTSPYTYSWTGGETTADASNLSAGTYILNVTDNNGCAATASVVISQPSSIGVSATVSANLHCDGANDGSISSVVSGGNSPYTYLWTNGATTANASGLSAGTYSVIITDNSGCSAGASVTVTQPNALSVSASTTANSNCGGSTGSASSSAIGGTSPYTYTWSGGGGNNANATGLAIGNYTVTIEDNCGNSSTASVVISGPSALGASANTTANVNCYGDNTGAATSTVSGGATPYTYIWTGGGATASINGVSAGTYTLVVEDACGNSYTTTTTITGPTSALSTTANITANVACNGGSTGAVSSTTSGGTSPYTYSWTGSAGSSSNAAGLSAGTYFLTVTDNNGCTKVTTVVITQPATIDITTSSVGASSGACNGTASVSVSGGTSPYTYSWNNASSSTTASITNQCAGSFCCTVTDANGCIESACVTISTIEGIAAINNASNINIYPDPSKGAFTVTGVIQGQVIEVYNFIGQELSSVKADNTTMYFNISNQSDGIYLIRILNTDGSLVTQKKLVKAQ